MRNPLTPLVAVLMLACVAVADDKSESDDTRTPAPPAKPPLKVTIIAPEKATTHNHLAVRFTNTSIDPVFILKPLDGSLWGWHMPHYRFDVKDGEGSALKLLGRCGVSGLWHETKFPDDYLVEIKPGKSFETQHYLPVAVAADGEYTARFMYRYVPGEATFKNPSWGVAERAWQGEVAAETVTLKLKKNQ